MRKLLSSEVIIFLLTFTPALLFWASLLGRLYPVHAVAEIPFFFDLIEVHSTLPSFLIYILGIIDFLLLWLISKKVFVKEFWIAPLVFSLSPWFAYLTFAGSFYIYLLTLNLFSFYGLLTLNSGKKRLGAGIFVIGCVLGVYNSLLLLVFYPLLITSLIIVNFIDFAKVKTAMIWMIILCLPLFLAIFKNQVGFKNIYKNQITIFSDPGLISAVNGLQGEGKQSGLYLFTRLAENKYIYLSEYALLKAVKHVVPSTFFTPQENLLRFSFTSPIFFAFLFPFAYGLFLVMCSKRLRKYLFVSLIMILPSFLSKSLVDLNRLIFFEPVIIFIITFGLINIVNKKNKLYKLFLIMIIFLIAVQFMNTLLDINLRELPRYERFMEGKFEIKL